MALMSKRHDRRYDDEGGPPDSSRWPRYPGSQMGAIAFPMPVMYAYCSSKGAVNKVMKMAARLVRLFGIEMARVNAGESPRSNNETIAINARA
jgi:NAD(P)-dependent dehydrogenase (short-subunit alcohol dehydrogenase family)